MAGQVAVQVGDTDTSRVIPCRPPTVTGAGDEVTRPGRVATQPASALAVCGTVVSTPVGQPLAEEAAIVVAKR